MHMCDMPHSYVWHAWFICVTCLIRDMPHTHVWYFWFICVISLIHMCDISGSYVWLASFTCVTCLIHMRDKPDSESCQTHKCCATRDMPHSETCHAHEWVMAHTYEWYVPFICLTWSIYTSHIWMSHVLHTSVVRHVRTPMGWRWSVGSIKL